MKRRCKEGLVVVVTLGMWDKILVYAETISVLVYAETISVIPTT